MLIVYDDLFVLKAVEQHLSSGRLMKSISGCVDFSLKTSATVARCGQDISISFILAQYAG